MAHKVLPPPEEDIAEEVPQEQCIHHWLIDPAHGPVSRGTCKVCGEEKDFLNAISESLWKKLEGKDDLIIS